MTVGLFLLLGLVVGGAQAGLLGREVRGRPRPGLLLARVLLVSVVLVSGARSGQLLPAAAGWLGGFIAAGWRVHRGLS